MNPLQLYREFREFQRIERLNEEKEILEALDGQSLHILEFPAKSGVFAECWARNRLLYKGHIQLVGHNTFAQTSEGHLALLEHRVRCGESGVTIEEGLICKGGIVNANPQGPRPKPKGIRR